MWPQFENQLIQIYVFGFKMIFSKQKYFSVMVITNQFVFFINDITGG